MTARKEYFYQSLGHELMKELAAALVGSELTPGGEPGAYQTLNLSNGMHVRFTQWRGGEGPFYIILFRGARYLFELDLSMIVHHDDHYTWNLKIPSHETNRNFLQAWLGAPEKFDSNYSRQVGIVKNPLALESILHEQAIFCLRTSNGQSYANATANSCAAPSRHMPLRMKKFLPSLRQAMTMEAK